jgi:Bacterial regulatory proteins, tetR family
VAGGVTAPGRAGPDRIRGPGLEEAQLGEHGIDGVRCEDAAARAGVGKATLYRRCQA